jgi:hypothetical protein
VIWIKLNSPSVVNPYPKRQNPPTKEKNAENSSFEELDVLSGGLEASSGTRKSLTESRKVIHCILKKKLKMKIKKPKVKTYN